MKILYLHNYYGLPGGEDSVFLNESRLLAEHGHDVKIFTVNNETDLPQIFKNPFYLKSLVSDFENIILHFNPDIIHCHNIFPLMMVVISRSELFRNFPVVVTVHNYRNYCLNSLLYKDGKNCELCITHYALDSVFNKCYRDSYILSAAGEFLKQKYLRRFFLLDNIKKFIFPTSYAEEKFILYGFDRRKTVVKPHFTYGAPNKSKEQGHYFLYAGRFDHYKNIRILTDIFMEMPDMQLIMTGSGKEWEYARLKAADSKNIKVLPHSEPQELNKLYRESIALLYPSLAPETFGLAIIEAFGRGIPAIAFNTGSRSEIIKDGYNGFIVEPENKLKFCDKIRLLFQDAQLQSKLGGNAYESYLNFYSPENALPGLIGIYENVIQKSGSAE